MAKSYGEKFWVVLERLKISTQYVQAQTKRMSLMYADRAMAARAATGNVFDDPLIRADNEFCKSAVDQMVK